MELTIWPYKAVWEDEVINKQMKYDTPTLK